MNRLLTTKEQAILIGFAGAVLLGAAALYTLREPEPGAVIASPVAIEQPQTAPTPIISVIDAGHSPSAPQDPPSQAITMESTSPAITVSVAGPVQTPGVYDFDKGERVQAAIDAAGGVTEAADLSDINLAALLIDGTTLTLPEKLTSRTGGRASQLRGGKTAAEMNPPQYTISGWRPDYSGAKPAMSTPSTVGAEIPASSTSPSTTSSSLLDLNTATQMQLEELPGIGPKLAEQIIAHRNATPFRTIDDLDNVPGIGAKRLESLRPLVTVSQ